MKLHPSIRTAAVVVAMAGLGFGLLGSGVTAAFTQNGSATQTVHVGSFGFVVSSTTNGAVVSGSPASNVLLSTDIESSAKGSAPLDFTVTSTGSMPVTVHVVGAYLSAPFTSLLANPIPDQVLAHNGDSYTYHAGIQWPELTNAILAPGFGNNFISYTITATA